MLSGAKGKKRRLKSDDTSFAKRRMHRRDESDLPTAVAAVDFASIFMDALIRNTEIPYDKLGPFNEYFTFLYNQPLGSWQSELCNNLLKHCDVREDSEEIDFRSKNNLLRQQSKFRLWLRIKCEQYINEPSVEKRELFLEEAERLIIIQKEKDFPKSGAKLPYSTLDHKLIAMVYFSEDEGLIRLFAKHLPIPRADCFESARIPRYIMNREEQINETIKGFLEKNKPEEYLSIEKQVIELQRLYRSKKRQTEERYRIPEVYDRGKAKVEIERDMQSQGTINNFGTPYTPEKCSSMLANRIVLAASKIRFFNYIRHETRKNAITSMFDGAIYGRKSLLMFSLPFSPAALRRCDIDNGDSNVVCFGSDYGTIDPITNGDVELKFQFDKLDFGPERLKHCAFFKQQDLGYENSKIRCVTLSEGKNLIFRHTVNDRCSVGFKKLRLEYQTVGQRKPAFNFALVGTVPNYKLISYDIQNIESVLILNFFRYLDALAIDDQIEASDVISAIYHDIEEMDDAQLAVFLEDIGRNLSDTMEFNFFGAYQIDFNALTHIKDKEYCLDMAELISELQNGELDILLTAKEKFPAIFKSYRFLDYLSTKTTSVNVLIELSNLRALCKTPGWYPMNEKLNREDKPSDCEEVAAMDEGLPGPR